MVREDYKMLLKEFNKKLVNSIVFTQEVECPLCVQTESLIEESASLSDKITVEV